MKGKAGITIGSTAMLLLSIGLAQTSTNSTDVVINNAGGKVAAIQPVTPDSSRDNSPILPLIEMRDVPVSAAVANLAREAGMNYLIDWRLTQAWADSREPAVTFKLQNITARDALQRILHLHNLALVEDPAAYVSRITSSNAAADAPGNRISADAVASALVDTNVIPLVQFSEVPLDSALDCLCHQSAAKFKMGPLQGEPSSVWFTSMPTVSIRWQKLTAAQRIFALCENYNLTVTRDNTTGVLFIKPKPSK